MSQEITTLNSLKLVKCCDNEGLEIDMLMKYFEKRGYCAQCQRYVLLEALKKIAPNEDIKQILNDLETALVKYA